MSGSANNIRTANAHPPANALLSVKASRPENKGRLASVEVCVANGWDAQNAERPPPRGGLGVGEASVGEHAMRAPRLSERPAQV